MTAHHHSCQICGYVDECEGVGRGPICEVDKAAQANKQGPFCEMCRNFIMFKRIAEHRGKSYLAASSAILDMAIVKGLSL